MHRTSLALALALALTSTAWAPQSVSPTSGAAHVAGTDYQGHTVQAWVPKDRQPRNIGGSDGLGLCGFTSIQYAATFQHLAGLEDLQQYMSTRPGGAWPEKVDQVIEQKLGPDSGLQWVHVYGSEAIPLIKRALATGRMPCISYGFGERYRLDAINHMVNLVCFDDEYAAVLDNNYPGTCEWMPADELLPRFEWVADRNGVGYHAEGWAIIFITNPQPPLPID